RGNSTIHLSLRVPPEMCRQVSVFKRQADSNQHTARFMSSDDCVFGTVKALVTAVGLGRVVNQGIDGGWIFDRRRSIEEDDDDVELRPFKSASVIDLSISQNPLYGLAVRGEKGDLHQVMFSSAERGDGTVAFDDLKSALYIRGWLHQRTVLGAGE